MEKGSNGNLNNILSYIATVFTFGHTNSGKTYTMFGNREKNPGIIPLTLETIFAYIYEVKQLNVNFYRNLKLSFYYEYHIWRFIMSN